MNARIEIVSASAGSGKTYKLAELLKEELAADRIRPEKVLATTFTRRAAAELQSRARRHLLSAGRVDDAQGLAAARIGTVHAVCGRIVSDYALELGLSPDLRVLDDVAAAIAFRRALTRVMDTSPEAEELDEVCQRFTGTAPRGASQEQWKLANKSSYDWRAAVGEVIEDARMNGLLPEDFARCAERSVEELIALLGKPTENADTLDDALRDAVEGFVASSTGRNDDTRKTKDAVQQCQTVLPVLQRGRALVWVEWARLSKLDVAKKSLDAVAPVLAAAAAHDRHPRLQEDLRLLIRGVFAVAARTVTAYAEHKRARGVLDFGDHEVLALQALRLPAVRDQLATEIDLVLIDEFQDTSPLQLAIFLELATLAPRSVWVGDQKQSIYAFRGADPALMDAVIARVLGGGEPETLNMSYRSRPQLVNLCSELFAHSFAPQGIRPAQVRLEPALQQEPPGLGPCVERWTLSARNKREDVEAIAGLVEEVLADPTVCVRDRHSGDARRLRPGDIAVLCRYNDTCDAVAHALAERRVDADLRRTGLMDTLEAHLVLAGLALFVAPDDRGAAARIVRLSQEDPGASDWLDAALTRGEEDPLTKHPAVQRVRDARIAHPYAGPLAALDIVIEALQSRQQALRWGNSALRLANLDALRDHAAALLGRTSDEVQAVTPAALLNALRTLKGGNDTQALLGDGDGVVVCTWHASKGLEWPITVLYELDAGEKFHPFDVQTVTDREDFSFDDPLDGRWIRFWPNPYGGQKKDVPLLDRLEHHPAMQRVQEMSRNETLRVLYVGMTRARDRLILAARDGVLAKTDLAKLVGAEAEPLISEPSASGAETVWAGVTLEVLVRSGAPKVPLEHEPTPGCAPMATGACEYAPAFLVPSTVGIAGKVAEVLEIGAPITLRGLPDMQGLGEALHGFFAADRPEFGAVTRLDLARDLLQLWGIAEHVSPEHALQASDGLHAWARARYPAASWHRELPLHHRVAGGTIVRGTADLALIGEVDAAVVDHKTYAGVRDVAIARAADAAGQLRLYADALRAASGRSEVATWVHLPIAGLVVRVEI